MHTNPNITITDHSLEWLTKPSSFSSLLNSLLANRQRVRRPHLRFFVLEPKLPHRGKSLDASASDWPQDIPLNQPHNAGQFTAYSSLRRDPETMHDLSSPQIVFGTPSELVDGGFRQAENNLRHSHPWCGNAEGWGPISSIRYDFTPCFLDVGIASVALYGLLGGAAAIVWLVRSARPQPVPKNWHFYAKLVCGTVRRACRESVCSWIDVGRAGCADRDHHYSSGFTSGTRRKGLHGRLSALDDRADHRLKPLDPPPLPEPRETHSNIMVPRRLCRSSLQFTTSSISGLAPRMVLCCSTGCSF